MTVYLSFTKPIPNCPGRITMKKLSGTTYVYYTYAQEYHPEKQNCIPKRVGIGKLTSDGKMLVPNMNYVTYMSELETPVQFRKKDRKWEEHPPVYYKIEVSPELILTRLRRLEMIYHMATESNEYCISEDVQHLLEQIAAWERTMKRRDSIKAKHHPETIEFMREFIKALEEFPNGGAELFPFEMIDKLTKEYLDA